MLFCEWGHNHENKPNSLCLQSECQNIEVPTGTCTGRPTVHAPSGHARMRACLYRLQKTKTENALRLLQPVRPPDHVQHDLVSPRADAVQSRIPPGPLDAVLLHVAGAAVDLNALVGDFHGDARSVQLGP